MALEIKDSNFEELLASGKPVVVDFWATWCGPCKKIAPDVEALAEEYKDQVIIGKCDVDDNDELTGRFGVRNIPTVLFIKDGEVKDKTVGAVTKAQLEETLDKAGIPIYTVGMRILSNQTLSTLDEISQLTGGSYYYSYRISNLPDNLKKIIGC